MSNRRRTVPSVIALAVAAVSAMAVAQQTPFWPPATAPASATPNAAVAPQSPPQSAAPSDAASPDASPPAAPAPAKLSNETLDGLLAPIALYPDALLSQALMASTYPVEVVEARRWLTANPNLTGDALADALAAQPWDPSVKSLIAVPTVLSLLDEKLEWTTRLGDAFLAQQRDVMDSVQRLRAQAQAAGYLKSDDKQKVSIAPAAPEAPAQQPPAQQQPAAQPPAPQQPAAQAPPAPAGGPYASPDGAPVDSPPVQADYPQQPIVIEPAQPQVVYVPVYDPAVVYGGWAYASPRPFFWRPYGYASTGAFFYDRPCTYGPAWSYAWARPDWRVRQLDLDIARNANLNARFDRDAALQRVRERDRDLHDGQYAWQHDRDHRRGVQYRDPVVARRFDTQTAAARTADARTTDARNSAARTRDDTATRTDADRTRAAQTDRAQAARAQAERAQSDRTPADRSRADTAGRSDADRSNQARDDTARRPVIPGAVARPDAPSRSADRSNTDSPASTAGKADRTTPRGNDANRNPAPAKPAPAVSDRSATPSDNAKPADSPARQRDRAAAPAPAPAKEAPAPKPSAPATPAPAKEAPAPKPAVPARPVPAAPAPATPAPSRGNAPERPAAAPERPAPRPAPAPEKPAPAAPKPAPAADSAAKSSDSGVGRSK